MKFKRSFTNGQGITACVYLEWLVSWFDHLENKFLLHERKINQTITEYCSKVDKYTTSIFVEQGPKNYSSSHIEYFFRKFGKSFEDRLTKLLLTHSMDITSLKPFLCKIKLLWFFNTHNYDVQSLYSLMSHVSNCSDGNVDTILFDYLHRKRDFDYIIANELALKSIFTVSYTHLTLPTKA